MEKLVSARSLSTGLAMFSMFFGAGNIIFPLAVGQFAGDKNLFAILGLILTAAIIPI
ncbi:MAG TPA: branched-chain amino acid transport system II carrier protein, partial [Waddliaceae bacterium]